MHLSIEIKNRELFDELAKKLQGSSIKNNKNVIAKNDEQDYEERQDNIEIPREIMDIEQ